MALRAVGDGRSRRMIVVLPDLHGTPRVLQLDRRGVIELSRVIEDGSCAGEVPESSANEAFAHAWARLRGEVRHAKHFANLGAALHFYRFGNHGLPAAEAARIVRRVRAAGVATVPAGA